MKGKLKLVPILIVVLSFVYGDENCGPYSPGDTVQDFANCEMFFVCVAGHLLQLHCPKGSQDDFSSKVCPVENCPGLMETTTIPTTTVTTPTPEDAATVTTAVFTPMTAPTVTTDAPDEPQGPFVPPSPISGNNPCTKMPNGLYINNPDSPKEFYYCYDGFAIPAACPVGYTFVFAQQICVPP